MLVSATRGALFNVVVAADAAFARIESELSGYYPLGVEFDPIDKDGKPHPVRVEVNRVRHGRAVAPWQLVGGVDRLTEALAEPGGDDCAQLAPDGPPGCRFALRPSRFRDQNARDRSC